MSAIYNIDLYSPSMRVNPFETYKRMRESAPVCQISTAGLWVISDYENVKRALKDYLVFSSMDNSELLQPEWMRGRCDHLHNYPLIFDDPPRHTKLRQVLNKNIINQEVNKLVPFMRKDAEHLIEAAQNNKEVFDFLQDFSRPYIGSVVGRMVGIEDANCISETYKWVALLERVPPQTKNQQYLNELTEANQKLLYLLGGIVEKEREEPSNAIIQQLLNSTVDGEFLTDETVIDILAVLIFGGYQAPTQFLCHAILQLVHNNDIWDQLASSQEGISLFVEEMLRFNSSVHFNLRKTHCPITLSGVTIPKGAPVIINIAAANRDPLYFPNPDMIDLTRTNKGAALLERRKNCKFREVCKASISP